MSAWSVNNEAARVWEIFSGMYGVRHTKDYGESVPDVWRQAIETLTEHEINRGLRRLTKDGNAYPPTLPQFMKACKSIGDDGPANPGAYVGIEDSRFDPYHCHAQRVMCWYLLNRKIQQSMLSALIRAKNIIVDQYRLIGKEEKVDGKEIKERLIAAFDAVVNEHAV